VINLFFSYIAVKRSHSENTYTFLTGYKE